jgi:riboflavin biosynthesis pyrimidine reductase
VVTHRLRQTCGALLVGAGTWLADGTRGTVRAVAGPEIPRIIWASRPLSSADAKRAAEQGWAVWGPRPGESPAAAWDAALSSCGLRGILVEGGARVLAELLALNLWDEAYRWQSPHPLPDPGTAAPAFPGAWMHVGRYGRDELYRARRVNFT